MASLPVELFGYRVIAKIGTGAASEVFVVQDIKSKNVWALKHVVHVDEKSERFIEQVEQEYAIGSKLDHKNIRGIYKILRITKRFTTTDIGLLMELIDADTLEHRKFKNFIEAAELLAQVARGLEHMNQRGFVHGDMKPINVMVTDKSQVKIIDLGQACALNEVKKRIQGTPGYIAPEQGHLQPITQQTDVYNFGAMAYFLFSGEVIPTVFPPQNLNSSSGVISTNMVSLPKPLCVRNPKIPEELSQLIQDCIQLDPADRVQGMGAVAQRLESLANSLNNTPMGMSVLGNK